MIALTEDIATALRIRRIVFVEEQGIALEEDVDGKDESAIHLLATDQSEVTGTARILMADGVGKIGRVAVLKEFRGAGIGKALIEFAVAEIALRGGHEARLGAQVTAIGFYEALGFEAVGEEFLDAGLPHQEMVCAI